MELERMCPQEFAQVYSLLEASFPTEEIRTYEEQRALLDDPRYGIWVLHRADGGILGLMAVWEFPEFAFIEHFAVDPAARNGGVGSAMLRTMTARLHTDICLEAEPPETELASRRIGFYRRGGFFANLYPYMQPSISGGRKPIPLVLMTAGRPISRAEFEDIRGVLYREVYKTGGRLSL